VERWARIRYTELTLTVRTLPPKEIWVGIIAAKRPYAAIASRLDGDDAPEIVCRFGSAEARGMASELIQLAAELEAPNN
jgi:hypothetical protein